MKLQFDTFIYSPVINFCLILSNDKGSSELFFTVILKKINEAQNILFLAGGTLSGGDKENFWQMGNRQISGLKNSQ